MATARVMVLPDGMDVTTAPLDMTLDDERLRPFLPLIYVAWSDGELTSNEMRDICDVVSDSGGIDIDCQTALGRWLNPADPPSPEELERLRRRIAEWASDLGLPTENVPIATQLGTTLATVTRSDHTVTSAESTALALIDERLGPLPAGPGLTPRPIRLSPIDHRPPSFDAKRMASIVDGDYRHTRAQMRELLSRPEFGYLVEPDRGQYREKVLEWTRLLALEGLGSLGYPAPYGAGDMAGFITVFRMLAHHDLSLLTKFGVQFGLFGGAIARLGTHPHHAKYLQDVSTLTLPGCFAMTETGHGSNVRDLETTATYDKETDELVINTPRDLASKDYIGNAALHGQLAVTFVRLIIGEFDHGVHAVLVPIRDTQGTVLEGVTVSDNGSKGGLQGVDNGRITFQSVRVPRINLLDRFATIDEGGGYHSDIPSPDRRFFTTIGTLVGGRISVGAAANSVAASALTIALRYAHRRRQFGDDPDTETLLIDYPLHQHRLIPRLAATYAYHFAFDELVKDYVHGPESQREIEARAAGLKALASWHSLDTVQTAREACGGQGYMAENRLTLMYEDADVFTTFEGDNVVLLQLVAKSLLSDFGQQFESMSTAGMIRYLVRRTRETLIEASAVSLSTTNKEQLTDATWQIDLLRRRTEHLVGSLARRIKNRTEDGLDSQAAFTQVQPHSQAAAQSHVELVLLTAFASRVEATAHGRERDTLDRLRALHGLTTIRNSLGWLQEHNMTSSKSASEIIKVHSQLVADLAEDSLGLVDAFAIPDPVLAAPIAIYQRKED